MKKILSKIIDVSILLFIWFITLSFLFVLVIATSDINFKYPAAFLLTMIPSVLILLFVYTRFWIKRWRTK